MNVLKVAAVAEIGTGVARVVAPAIVAMLLLGTEIPSVGLVVARCFGIGLLALGLACWPDPRDGSVARAPRRGMLTYNLLLALYLFYIGTMGDFVGILLWPVAALHGAIAFLLIREGRSATTGP